MTTALTVRINYVDADVNYATTPADYIALDLVNDYLIWTKGNATVKDLMTHEPTASELNAAAEEIDPLLPVTVSKCLLMDYSHDVGGAYYTHLVKGMSENKKFVFCFSLDGATATEPQLEAWDTSAHSTANKHVLGAGVPANSMMKGVCTTTSLPGAGWAGTALAGASNVLLLNDGSGALIGAADLYANLKIKIPAAYSTPAAETFVLTVRYTYV
jgi:hypothetical protein